MEAIFPPSGPSSVAVRSAFVFIMQVNLQNEEGTKKSLGLCSESTLVS